MSDIMAISRLRMGTDGTGIRTLIGFYGCPLQCKYCINRECHERDAVRADYTPEELIEVLSIDEPYFLMTNGGITFGGGEPLLQAAFIHEVCQKMNPKWGRVMETSLYASWDQIELLIPDINTWIIDIKDLNRDIYESYTGKSNDLVLENLRKLVEKVPAENILVRIPYIPGYNTREEFSKKMKWIWKPLSPEVVENIIQQYFL